MTTSSAQVARLALPRLLLQCNEPLYPLMSAAGLVKHWEEMVILAMTQGKPQEELPKYVCSTLKASNADAGTGASE